MYTFVLTDQVRQDLIRVLSSKLKVNDTIALCMSMSGLFVAVLAVS